MKGCLNKYNYISSTCPISSNKSYRHYQIQKNESSLIQDIYHLNITITEVQPLSIVSLYFKASLSSWLLSVFTTSQFHFLLVITYYNNCNTLEKQIIFSKKEKRKRSNSKLNTRKACYELPTHQRIKNLLLSSSNTLYRYSHIKQINYLLLHNSQTVHCSISSNT